MAIPVLLRYFKSLLYSSPQCFVSTPTIPAIGRIEATVIEATTPISQGAEAIVTEATIVVSKKQQIKQQ